MGKKKEYKEANRRFLKNLSFQEGVFALPCGIYYKILETGEGTVSVSYTHLTLPTILRV